jgi:hypothetical protein
MNLNKIINRISIVEETAAYVPLEKAITEDIKKKFDISPMAEAFKTGANSAIFENNRGNIVAFIAGSPACITALRSVGKNSEILPEVYDMEILDLKIYSGDFRPYLVTDKVCVIEMEKLLPLNNEERTVFIDNQTLIPEEVDLLKTEMEEQILKGMQPDSFMKNLINLSEKMIKENISHDDLHVDNVMWSKDRKNLKLIDWESIYYL